MLWHGSRHRCLFEVVQAVAIDRKLGKVLCVKMKNSRLRRRCGRLRIKLARIGEDSRAVQPSVHMSISKRHSYQLGTTFLQLSVLDLHAILGLSWFWNLSRLFFKMHVADPVMMHCGMGSVGSLAFDIWPRVLATRRCVTGIASNRLGVFQSW